MSDSSTILDTVSQSSAQKEVQVNALVDALSPSSIYGRRASTCSGLVWGYYGGKVLIGSTVTTIANGTLTLSASSTNYIEADASTGAVSSNTSAFTSGRVRLYTAVTGTSTVTSYTDQRTCATGFLNSTGLSSIAAHTFLGNNTGSTAAPIALTATQLTAELNALVGDSGSGGTKGLVPAPAAGDAAALKFLKADGTWASPGTTFTGGTLTSTLVLRTGGTAAGSEPIKFVSGSLLSAATAGTMEFLTDAYYGTITTGPTRKQFAMMEGFGTGRLAFVNASNRIDTDASMTWNGATLTVPNATVSNLTGGRVTYASASGLLSDSANHVWDNANGRLGVGNSSPQAIVHATSATGAGQGAIRSEQSGNGTGDYAGYDLWVNSALLGDLRALPSGFTSVGINIASSVALTARNVAGLVLKVAAAGPIIFGTGVPSGGNGGLERMRIDATGNVVINTAAIATNATDGFLYLPTCAGTPTGTPTTYSGRAAHVYDTTNHKLWVFDGAWKGVVVS